MSESDQPDIRISTIIPVYNGAATVARAIDSAFAQDYLNQEIIVVNDGSVDGTAEILKSFKDRINVINTFNGGAGRARNLGITAARGELVALLDADDAWLPGRLAKTVSLLRENTKTALVFSDYKRIDQTGSIIDETTVPAHRAHPPSMDEILSNWWPISPTTVTMRKTVWERCGRFRTDLPGFEDIEFFIRARQHGDFEYIGEPLALFQANDPEKGPDKWPPDNFIRLLRNLYGERSANFVAEVRSSYASAYAAKALREMDCGNRAAALRCWSKVLKFDPIFLFRTARLSRLAHPQNLARVAKMILRKRNLPEDAERA